MTFPIWSTFLQARLLFAELSRGRRCVSGARLCSLLADAAANELFDPREEEVCQPMGWPLSE